MNILEELQRRTEVSGDSITEITSNNHLRGYFSSNTIFNLSHRFLTDPEIKILEKGLDFAPIQRKTNETELRILKNPVVALESNGIFEVNLLQTLAIQQPLLPNLRGNHLKVILIWKFF